MREQVVRKVADSRSEREREIGAIGIELIQAVLACVSYQGTHQVGYIANPESMLSPGFYELKLLHSEGSLSKKDMNVWVLVDWLIEKVSTRSHDWLTCGSATDGAMGETPCRVVSENKWRSDVDRIMAFAFGPHWCPRKPGQIIMPEHKYLCYIISGEQGELCLNYDQDYFRTLAIRDFRNISYCPWILAREVFSFIKEGGVSITVI